MVQLDPGDDPPAADGGGGGATILARSPLSFSYVSPVKCLLSVVAGRAGGVALRVQRRGRRRGGNVELLGRTRNQLEKAFAPGKMIT